MKQLSLILLLATSYSSFAIGLPPAFPYGMKSSEKLDPTIKANHASPYPERHKPHSNSLDLSLHRGTFIEFVRLAAREPGEPRPPFGMFRHFKAVPDENH